MEGPSKTDLVSSAGSSFITGFTQLSPWHDDVRAVGTREPDRLGLAAGTPWLRVDGLSLDPLLVPGNAVWAEAYEPPGATCHRYTLLPSPCLAVGSVPSQCGHQCSEWGPSQVGSQPGD